MADDGSLTRGHELLAELDACAPEHERFELLDSARGALLDARRARSHPDAIRSLMLQICNVAAADASPAVRTVAPAVVEDLCLRDLHAFVVDGSPFLSAALNDADILVIQRAVRTVTALFRRVMGLAVACGVGSVPSSQQEFQPLPQQCYHSWLEMRDRVMTMMHHEHDGISKAAVKFAETVVLALTYSGAGGSGYQDHFTLDFAQSRPMLSESIQVGELEQSGNQSVTKLVSFVTDPIDGAEGKQESRIRPNPYITALVVLGNLARRRKLLLELILPALLRVAYVLVTVNQPHLCVSALSKGQRASAVMALRLSLQALRSYSHVRAPPISQVLSQTCTALSTFEAREYGGSIQAKRDDGRKVTAAAATAAPAAAVRDVLAPALATVPSKASDNKRPFSSTTSVHGDVGDLPPPEVAAWAATLYGQMLPHHQLVDVIISTLRRSPARGAEQQKPELRRPEKRTRISDPGVDAAGGGGTEITVAVPRRQVQRRTHAPPVIVPHLESEHRHRLLHLQCRRIMQSEAKLGISGASSLRLLVLTRMLGLASDLKSTTATEFIQETIEFIVDEFPTRLELALTWLHAEAAKVCRDRRQDFPSQEESTLASGKARKGEDIAVKAESLTAEIGVKHGVAIEGNLASVDRPSLDPESKVAGITNGSETSRQTDIEADERQILDSCEVARASGAMSPRRDAEASDSQDCELGVAARKEYSLSGNYEFIMLTILKIATEKLGPEDRLISRLVVEAPFITDAVLQLVESQCRDAARSRLGLSTLRDIIIERPGIDRDRCLGIMLGFTVDNDDVLRGPAVRLVASKLFEEMTGSVPALVEQFATRSTEDALLRLAQDCTADGDTERDGRLFRLFERNVGLLAALCAKMHDLLERFAAFYTDAPKVAKPMMAARARDIAAQIGSNSPALIALVRGEDGIYAERRKELDDLALVMTSAAVVHDAGQVPDLLVTAVRVRYERAEDVRLLRAVLPGLKHDELKRYLGVLVTAGGVGDSGDQRTADPFAPVSGDAYDTSFKAVVREMMGVRPRPMSPSDLLVELHALPVNSAVRDALRACFELKVIFKCTDIGCALQHLIAKDPVPALIMQTVSFAQDFQPSLASFIRETVLVALIRKTVWHRPLLWTGFAQYCSNAGGDNLGILALLPLEQVVDMFKDHRELRGRAVRLLRHPNVQMRKTVRKHLAAAVLQTAH